MWLNARHAQARFGLSARQLRRLRDQSPDRLGSVKRNRRWYYPSTRLEAATAPKPVDLLRQEIMQKYGLIGDSHATPRNPIHHRLPRPTSVRGRSSNL